MKKMVLALFSTIVGATVGAAMVFKRDKDKMKKEIELDRKNDAILKLLSQWMSVKQEGKSLVQYFQDNKYGSIAVYGLHYLGECLVNELKDSGVQVRYAIDRNVDKIHVDITLYRPEEELPEVDAIVVTPFYYFDEIDDMLSEKMDCPIVSIEDVIYEV